MGAAPGAGWDEGEFEFKLVFEEESQGPSPVRTSEPDNSGNPEKNEDTLLDYPDTRNLVADNHLATSHDEHLIIIPSPPPLVSQQAGMNSPPPRRAAIREFIGTYESLPARSVQVSESRVVECPSIQITTISPEDDPPSTVSRYWDMGDGGGGGCWDRERLYLPLLDPFTYRDRCPSSPSPSPASSPSSRGWLSPASSCDSLLVEEEDVNDATMNFMHSPSSRPTSPGGKKRRNTPFASPDTRRSSYSEDLHGCDLEGGDSINLTQAQPISCELSIPQKTRKTSLGQLSPREVDQEQSPGPSSPCLLSETQKTRREPPSLGMDYLSVPPALAWGRARVNTHSPLFRSNALPPLDWPLPSQFDQYELRIEVQPRPHHRAHYETEGSRGAVKATPTGHPVVKVFVGTADDRSIRPHPFYQIHRVTGKMVGTASHESVQAGTKLLDIPLTPENNMTVLIDCAGILKLRNSDIELRKGETDVGRKNTRVRLVFRVHLPLAPPVAPSGRVLALQVASLPIECSQRSAQELPVIESISLTSCSVEGGEELMLSGSNFLPVSRVLFTERGTDGKFQWEEEAHVDRDNSNECLLCVRIPTYSDLSIARPVSVNLYVSNGKRKRSSTHCFKYLPIMFKEEDPLLSSLQPSAQHLDRGTVCQLAGQRSIDRGFHMRSDPMNKDRGLGFHFSPYPSTYSPPCPTMSCPDDYISKPDVVLEEPRAILSERHPSFENLELGFTELLPPLYSRGPQAHSPSPWLDSPYLSSSPSPSHSSSFSPFPASSPISTSPLPPIPTSPYLQCSPYPQEVCSSPPSRPSPYQNISSTPYSQYDSWEMQGGAVETEYVRERAEKIQECPLEFNSSASMHHITFDEVTQLIGEDIHSYQSQMNN
ncbi:nuclear factor of activated T-cells, cytoplasmic 4 isoform X2 [Takifugu rubripes]|uniref:nuclear factor of activated T-cells, cytoplasmic 4 isoform X2 n=1 Tax=Takifugu rubripes TaxID=31033 RepID=UPI0005D25B74|nr:nuclear factor of activated T-cells, cytoplasmic 4 isoform X2 [Takifugu rubripes]XP_056913635.1 nuclear factor of activated T-cells, cytoplasmic 4 isoform X2 [Takifugu flavidus]|eukprot:XP_011617866.1 PREDICTED: nuclear factor of activated T-cells, cytoplasmic 4-like isoform X2 [Takifugu rubripes]